ncbi:MAG: sulfatase-like hydrolase/transferase, partial [Nannocystaceae bacterium]
MLDAPSDRQRAPTRGDWTTFGSLVVVSAVLAGLLTAALDVALGGAMTRLSLTAWFVQWAMHTVITGVVGALAYVVVRIARRRPFLASMFAGLYFAGPALWMGDALASGNWIAQQPWAWAVRLGPPVCGGLGLVVVTRLLLAVPPPQGERRRSAHLLTAACAVAAIVFAIADAKVMRVEHPRFHVVTHACTCLWMLLFVGRLAGSMRGPQRASWQTYAARIVPVPALLIAVAGVAKIPAAAKGELVMHSPLAGHLMRALGFGGSTQVGEFFSTDGQGELMATLDLPRGLIKTDDDWNVLLVIVDTLRADALPPVRTRDTEYVEAADTPFLNDFIAGSFQFSRAYAQAAATHYSVPTLFRSIEAFEDAGAVGTPLPVYMNELGRPSFGVFNRFFIQPHTKKQHRAGDRLKDLTEDFDRIGVYDEREQNELIPLVGEQLDAAGDDPFFGWVHFYNMHDPGWDDRHLRKSDGSWVERYRRSLRWLDGQFAELIGLLEKRGLADKTIIVIASDHGEGLGAHGIQYHGKYMYDSVLRVPLIVHVPGVVGRVVDTPV